jgi:hypothetical protein
MDEYEKRMLHKAAIESLVNIVVAFKPEPLLTVGSGKDKVAIISDELFQRYAKRWIDMSYNFLDKAEALGAGYADYTINLLGLKIAKSETTS